MSSNRASKTIVLIPLLIGVIWFVYSFQFLSQGIFWDLGIYEKAIEVFRSGGNPYELNGYLSFVYHPLVLRFMALFGSHLDIALMVAYVGSLLFLMLFHLKIAFFVYQSHLFCIHLIKREIPLHFLLDHFRAPH